MQEVKSAFKYSLKKKKNLNKSIIYVGWLPSSLAKTNHPLILTGSKT